MLVSPVYNEVIDFLAAGTTPDSLIAFQPSENAKRRVEYLIQRENVSSLSSDETGELNHYLFLEHLLRLAKSRARPHLKSRG